MAREFVGNNYDIRAGSTIGGEKKIIGGEDEENRQGRIKLSTEKKRNIWTKEEGNGGAEGEKWP